MFKATGGHEVTTNENYFVKRDPKTFEQAANQIANFITSEKLPVDSKIPSERKLSELLDISRSSVREGLRVLNLLNYLEPRQGDGTFVTQPPPFLIPENMIDVSIEKDKLNNYFGIFLMCSEKILQSAIEAKGFIEHLKKSQLDAHQPFWASFAAIIQHASVYSKNPYYFKLWQSVYEVLEKNQYFKDFTSSIIIDDLYFALNQHDQQQLMKIFREIGLE